MENLTVTTGKFVVCVSVEDIYFGCRGPEGGMCENPDSYREFSNLFGFMS